MITGGIIYLVGVISLLIVIPIMNGYYDAKDCYSEIALFWPAIIIAYPIVFIIEVLKNLFDNIGAYIYEGLGKK